MMAAVDGFDGEVVFEASEEICSRARNRIRGETEKQQILQEMKGKENITVPANIKEFTSEPVELHIRADGRDVEEILGQMKKYFVRDSIGN